METTLENLRYPVGHFDWSAEVTKEDREKAIRVIAAFPAKISHAIRGLNEVQLDTPYRPDGWTVRQVVHHCADSHMNAYIRFKLTLTEEKVTIRPYDQTEWAKLPDSRLDPAISLQLIDGIHQRWVEIMKHMSDVQWALGYIHPEHNAWQGLNTVASMYAWHCEHHFSHIDKLKSRMGW